MFAARRLRPSPAQERDRRSLLYMNQLSGGERAESSGTLADLGTAPSDTALTGEPPAGAHVLRSRRLNRGLDNVPPPKKKKTRPERPICTAADSL